MEVLVKLKKSLALSGLEPTAFQLASLVPKPNTLPPKYPEEIFFHI
jgi:hypothetical protein